MADLDEISLMLGNIQADVRHTAVWIEKYEKLDKDRSEKIFNRLDVLSEFANRVEILEQEFLPLKAHFELAKIREYKLAGAIVVIGGLVSVVGTVLFGLWRNIAAYFSG